MWILINPSMMDGALEHNGKTLLSAERLETCCKLCHKRTSNFVENNNLRAHHNTTHLHGRLSPLFTGELLITHEGWQSSRAQWSPSHAPYAATMPWESQRSRNAACATLSLCPLSVFLGHTIIPPDTAYLNTEQMLEIDFHGKFIQNTSLLPKTKDIN